MPMYIFLGGLLGSIIIWLCSMPQRPLKGPSRLNVIKFPNGRCGLLCPLYGSNKRSDYARMDNGDLDGYLRVIPRRQVDRQDIDAKRICRYQPED